MELRLRQHMRRTVAIAALVAAVLVGLGPTRPAFAHASLLSAVPADGAVIVEAPKTFQLEFNEPVSPLVMHLIGPDGRVTNLTRITASNNAVVIAAPAMPRQGSYVLSWRVISADGHPVGGVVSFALGHPSSGVSAPAVVGALPVHAAIWVTQVALMIALFVGVGGAAFAAWLGSTQPIPGRGYLAAIMLVGFVAALLSLPLQGLDALAQPLTEIWRPAVWAEGYATSWGSTVLIASITLAVALLALGLESRLLARLLTALAVIDIGLAFAASGHASTTPPRYLTAPSVFIHAVCITVWIGSLLPLAMTLRAGDQAALRRFSRIIPVPVGLLIATGIFLAVVELDRPDALWTTAYGIVLSAKLAAVVALLALAALNRLVLVPRLSLETTQRLVAVIATEFVLALAVLGIVGLWRFTAPPLALAAAETTYIHFHAERAMADIRIKPVRDRGASASIAVTSGNLTPIAPKEVTLVIWNPRAGIEPIRRDAVHKDGARWVVSGLHIPVAGVWRMRLEILIGDFDKVAIEDNVELPRAP
jgi:copper transport protein